MSLTTTTLSTTNSTVFSASADTLLSFMSLCNTSASAVTVSVYIVPSAGIPGPGNIFIQNLEILAGDTYVLYQGAEKIVLGAGDTISASASVASVVTVIANGVLA